MNVTFFNLQCYKRRLVKDKLEAMAPQTFVCIFGTSWFFGICEVIE